MQYKVGRLIDHIHLRARDLKASKRFYEAALGALGRRLQDGGEYAYCDELYIDAGDQPSRIHLAFQAPDREVVNTFYTAALASGGRDNGAPGDREYHTGYYAAFVLDPDGNNIEAVYQGPTTRSAEAITIDRP